MNVVIIEDEDLAAVSLVNLLTECSFEITVVKRLESVQESILWLKENTCDLIFSDIHLGDGESFEIFRTLDCKIPIVFTTAYDKYAVTSFEFFAIDYLLKPYNIEKVEKALEKFSVLKPVSKGEYAIQIEALLAKMKPVEQVEKERFLVSKGNLFVSIQQEDIAFFMAQGKNLFLYTNKGESYLYNDTISNLETKLSTKYFFKINRKFIIQHKAIQNISKYGGNRIKVELAPNPPAEESILVSTQKTNEFKDWLNY